MKPYRKADLRGIGFESKTNDYLADNQRAFSMSNCSETMPLTQCDDCALRDRRIRQFERLTATLAQHIDAMRSREVRQ